MNLVTAIILFNVLVLIYQIIIEIFTMLCRMTGISKEKSRFQVISLITGTGFTTTESDLMLLTKKRRMITQRIMFFSYIFNISIISIFINIFISFMDTNLQEIKTGLIFTAWNIVLIIFMRKSSGFKKIIDKIVMYVLEKDEKEPNNYISIYDTYGEKVIAEVELNNPRKDIKQKNIEESMLKQKYGIQVLVIKRKSEIISDIKLDTQILDNDTLIVFGKTKDIKRAFRRKR